MLMQNNMIANGWPLVLGNMNMRFEVAEASASPLPYTRHRVHSSSFSSLSSSNLDTESTASFFPDQSVSLGRLLGIRPRNIGSKHCPNSVIGEQHGNVMSRSDDCRGLCARLLNIVKWKMSRSRSCSRH